MITGEAAPSRSIAHWVSLTSRRVGESSNSSANSPSDSLTSSSTSWPPGRAGVCWSLVVLQTATMTVSMVCSASEIGAVPASCSAVGGMPTLSDTWSGVVPAALATSRSSSLKGVDASSSRVVVVPSGRRRRSRIGEDTDPPDSNDAVVLNVRDGTKRRTARRGACWPKGAARTASGGEARVDRRRVRQHGLRRPRRSREGLGQGAPPPIVGRSTENHEEKLSLQSACRGISENSCTHIRTPEH
eukprot:scaffold98689_cov69-Phaeocystis_antarctica.AAC.5